MWTEKNEPYDIEPTDKDEEYPDWFDPDDEYYTCSRPGRHGCGHCDGCLEWGDAEYDAIKSGDYDY